MNLIMSPKMLSLEQFSIEQLEGLEDSIPEIAGFPSRLMAGKRGYETWIARLYQDVDNIIKNRIYPSASYRQDDAEDRYNVDIAGFLSQIGYQASHDKWMNGHPDIYVESSRGFKWIAESKLHSDYGTLLSGFKQLCERYSSGFVGQNHGAILIITKNISIKSLMNTWKERLSNDEDYKNKKVVVDNCQIDELCFISKHEHTVTGESFTVRHLPISILCKPTDKSALARKK
jgi:hypothetical protein